jgi:hypothetical protein
MDDFERLLQRCELLKSRIREFKSREVDETQESIKKIQIKMLSERLSEVGRQLNYLTLYKERQK